MRELRFPSAWVVIHADRVESTFDEDGSVSLFCPPVGKPAFEAAARYAGYADSMLFGLEHDAFHHVVAHRLGWRRSWVVWWDAHGQPDDPATQGWRDLEEHIVIRMQRFINTGERDEDYGVLEAHFGRDLPLVARDGLLLVRPWLVSEG